MTETAPTTFVIPSPGNGKFRGYYRVDRDTLVDLIADVETTFHAVDASDDCIFGDEPHGDEGRMRAYMNGTLIAPYNLSDQELLELWNQDSYERLVKIQRVDWDIDPHIGPAQYVPKAEAEAALAHQREAFQQGDILTIEGMTDGETLEIGRDALIQRLVALRIDMAIRPMSDMQADTHAGYADILRGGFKGFEHSGADELLETWRADRKEFYNRIFECLPLRIHESDPEWEDLANFDPDADNDTTSTPLY